MLGAFLLFTRAMGTPALLAEVLALSPKVEWSDSSLKLKEHANKGEVLVKLPFYIAEGQEYPRSEHCADQPFYVQVCCRLAIEKLFDTEPSAVRDFVHSLPKTYPTYPFWDPIAAKLFLEMGLGNLPNDSSVIVPLKRILVTIPGISLSKLNYEFFNWVIATYHRYRFPTHTSTNAVSPLADFVRYSPEYSNYVRVEDGHLVLKAGSSLEKGAYVEWNYGEDFDNPSLVLFHGFLHSPNPNNKIPLTSTSDSVCFGYLDGNFCHTNVKRKAISNELLLTMHFNIIGQTPKYYADFWRHFLTLPLGNAKGESQFSMLLSVQRYRKNILSLQQGKSLRTMRRLLKKHIPLTEAKIVTVGLQLLQIKLAQLAEAERLLMKVNCQLLGL
mmetsp:Transcript_18150/g.32501  ORF Transcript_18150/g.32501 Transcript_18150/m.32501 type:complete len:385 (+) Transcript_18150:2840-3994(+)